MPWNVAERAIDMVFEQPDCGLPPQISFFGGEPLLKLPLLKRCIEYAESKQNSTGKSVRFSITTNGIGLTDNEGEYLKLKKVEPTLSFDGIKEAQDACRRYKGGDSSFDDTRDAMLLFLKHFPDLAVCAVVSPENVRNLPETIDFFLEAGISRLLLNPNFFAKWKDDELVLWRRGYEHAGRRFEEEFKKGRIFHINFITAKIATRLKGGYDICDCCDFGKKEIAVAPSGNIYPCQRMVGEDTDELGLMGNVFKGLDAKTCRELEGAGAVSNSECAECDLKTRCRNWCSCVNHRLTGWYDRTGDLVCFHERMAIEIADDAASRLYKKKDKTFMEAFYFEKQVSSEWV
jgi:uncharacterized protein